MKQFRKLLVLALGFGAMFAAIALVSSGPATAQKPSTPVTVVNTTAEPVPTSAQGTTAVAGTVNAVQSGAWNVGITGTPSVNISNAPNVNAQNLPLTNNGGTPNAAVAIKSVDEPGRRPFQTLIRCRSTAQTCTGNLSVPSGSALVIEYIHIETISPNPGTTSIQTTAGGNTSVYDYPFGTALAFGNEFVYSQQVRIYADPSSTITFEGAQTLATSFTAEFDLNLSGYTVPVP
jgi:hypothetical protein